MRGHLLKLHAKTTPSYIRDLSIRGFWHLQGQGAWIQSPKDTEEGGRCPPRASAAPPGLDAVSSTAAQLLTHFQPTVSLPGFPNHDVSSHHPHQLTCHIHLQSYWVAVFLFLEQHVAFVSAACLLHK